MRATYKLFLCSLLAFSACTQNEESNPKKQTQDNYNDLIANEVIIKYEHNLTDTLFRDKYSILDIQKFSNTFIDNCLEKDYPIYDGLNLEQKLDKQEIINYVGTRVDTIIDINEETLDTVVTIREKSFDRKELSRLFIEEEWSFNKETFTMTKEIQKYAPIRVYVKDKLGIPKEVVKNLLFWVKSDNTSKEGTLIVENYAYEFDLYNASHPDWLQGLSVNRFVKIILDKVLSGETKAFEFDFLTNEKKALTISEAKERLGATVENYFTQNENTGEIDTVQVIGNIYPDEIKAVVFVEDWYMDFSNLKLTKKVKKIIPVRKYDKVMEATGEIEEIKTIPFFVELNY